MMWHFGAFYRECSMVLFFHIIKRDIEFFSWKCDALRGFMFFLGNFFFHGLLFLWSCCSRVFFTKKRCQSCTRIYAYTKGLKYWNSIFFLPLPLFLCASGLIYSFHFSLCRSKPKVIKSCCGTLFSTIPAFQRRLIPRDQWTFWYTAGSVAWMADINTFHLLLNRHKVGARKVSRIFCYSCDFCLIERWVCKWHK